MYCLDRRSRRGCVAVWACLAISGPALAGAQQESDYPARTIRLISGFAPGGATDVVARVIAQNLTEAFGQTVVVENRPGASGNIGADSVARSAPDGYTLYLANATIAMPSMFPRLPFNAGRDFAPVSLVGYGPSVLVVNPKFPVRSVPQLIDYLTHRPGKVDYASGGVGNITHMSMELFESMAGVEMVHVPYKGGAPSTNAVMAGEGAGAFSSITAVLSHIRQGSLVPLAISSSERSPALPDVPTLAEAGVPGYEATSWYGILVPAATPAPVVEKLAQAIRKSLQRKDFQDKLLAQGVQPATGGAAEFKSYMTTELHKWADIIAKAKITAE